MSSLPRSAQPPSCPAAGHGGRSAFLPPSGRSTANKGRFQVKRTGSAKARIVAAKRKHPHASARFIAQLVGVTPFYVTQVLRATAMVDDTDAVELGVLARDLGFTKEMLRTIAAQWR